MATIPLGLYLWRRIKQVGIGSVMGVPGDFNLNFLDYIYDVDGLTWVGNANELNAAYAADGYARVKGVPGCLVTTHGVGELSALNGIAGAASESIPVIHVVGQTARYMQDHHIMIHHSIGFQPDHQLYNKASKHFRCAEAELWDPSKAPALIDNAIRQCFIQKQPVYIYFPVDLSSAPVPAHLLNTPIDLSFPADAANETAAVDAIIAALSKSENPCILVDAMSCTHARQQTRTLVDKLQLPTYAAHMGKSVIDENHPCYVGLYNGLVSCPGIQKAVEESDLVLAVGWFPTDTNTAAFTRKINPSNLIEINPRTTVVNGTTFSNVFMAPLLSHLTAAIKEHSPVSYRPIPSFPPAASPKDASATHITQSYIWPRLSSFFQPGDVVIGDTGTTSFGLPDATLPRDSIFISQTYYGSIGYATPAALGADVALREIHEETGAPRRRTVLVTGDGSIQLTIQEVGTMITRGLRPVILVINNNGYTIERAIHGAKAQYNDIAPYRWSKMLDLFGAKNPEQCYRCVSTKQELDAVLSDKDFTNSTEVQVLEVRMDVLDIPWRLAQLLRNRNKESAQHLVENGFTNSGPMNGEHV